MLDAEDGCGSDAVGCVRELLTRQAEREPTSANLATVHGPLHHVRFHMTDDAAQGGEQKRGPGRPGGLVPARARQARWWRSFGFQPEELVGAIAPELKPPSPDLSVGQLRRRARKELARWERQLCEDEAARGLVDQSARKEAAGALVAWEKANDVAAALKRRELRAGGDPERNPDFLRAEASRLRAMVDLGRAENSARSGEHAFAWHDMEHSARFDEEALHLAEALVATAAELPTPVDASRTGACGPVRTLRVEDLTPEQRAKYQPLLQDR